MRPPLKIYIHSDIEKLPLFQSFLPEANLKPRELEMSKLLQHWPGMQTHVPCKRDHVMQ